MQLERLVLVYLVDRANRESQSPYGAKWFATLSPPSFVAGPKP